MPDLISRLLGKFALFAFFFSCSPSFELVCKVSNESVLWYKINNSCSFFVCNIVESHEYKSWFFFFFFYSPPLGNFSPINQTNICSKILPAHEKIWCSFFQDCNAKLPLLHISNVSSTTRSDLPPKQDRRGESVVAAVPSNLDLKIVLIITFFFFYPRRGEIWRI